MATGEDSKRWKLEKAKSESVHIVYGVRIAYRIPSTHIQPKRIRLSHLIVFSTV